MATQTKAGKKRHNWTTNGTVVDSETDLITRRFIDSCVHLTPAREAELDNLIGVGSDQSEEKPDAEILDAMAEDAEEWGNWDDVEPTAKELRAIERG